LTDSRVHRRSLFTGKRRRKRRFNRTRLTTPPTRSLDFRFRLAFTLAAIGTIPRNNPQERGEEGGVEGEEELIHPLLLFVFSLFPSLLAFRSAD